MTGNRTPESPIESPIESQIDSIIRLLGVTDPVAQARVVEAFGAVPDSIFAESLYSVQRRTVRVLGKLCAGGAITDELRDSYAAPLKQYHHAIEMSDIRDGAYIRWIRREPDASLTIGAFVMSIESTPDGPKIHCRIGRSRFVSFYMDDVVIFVRYSKNEWIVLTALQEVGVD
jgi:hypothetical protein